MPKTKSCMSLRSSCLDVFSKSIVGFCVRKGPVLDGCELYDNTKSTSSEHNLSDLRNLLQLPIEIGIDGLNTSLSMWKTLKLSLNYTLDQEGTVFYLLHYFFLRNSFMGKLEIKYNFGVDFVIHCLRKVQDIVITWLLTNERFEELVFALSHVASLELTCGESGFCLPVIGRLCTNLRKLILHNDTSKISSRIAFEFAHPNYPKKCDISKVCASLTYLSAKCDSEAIIIILEKFKNLTYFGGVVMNFENIVNHSDVFLRQPFPCKLKHVIVGEVDDKKIDFQSIYEKFPCLSIVTIITSDPTSVLFPAAPEIIVLIIINSNGDTIGNLPKSFNSTSWTSLTALNIRFRFITSIDLSIISKSCPNITELCLVRCLQDINKIYYPFPNLSTLVIYGVPTPCNILKIQAGTVSSFGFAADSYGELRETLEDIQPDQCSTMALTSFYHQPSLRNVPEILNLLRKFPSLSAYGVVIDDQMRTSVVEQCHQLFWDMKILTNFPRNTFSCI